MNNHEIFSNMAGNTSSKNQKVELHFFVNYFLKDGDNPPEWMNESIQCLRSAIQYALEDNICAQAHIKTSDKDFSYFNRITNPDKNTKVKVLPDRSSRRQFPYLSDILTGNQELESLGISGDVDQYVIYANADICIPKYFFAFALQQIALYRNQESKPISFVVNRKDVLGEPGSSVTSAENKIKMHPGYDLFIFNARELKNLKLGEVAVGTPPVGALLKLNLENLSEKVVLFNDPFLTWHRGEDLNWQNSPFKAERERNKEAASAAIKELAKSLQIPSRKLHATGCEFLLRNDNSLPRKAARARKRIFQKLKRIAR